MRILTTTALLLALSSPVLADKPATPPEETGAKAIEEAEKEPQVTIVQKGADTVEEYRLNGLLYMIKITPKKGPPYYLIDSDGDGNLETRRNDLMPGSVPVWVLFRW